MVSSRDNTDYANQKKQQEKRESDDHEDKPQERVRGLIPLYIERLLRVEITTVI